MDRKEKSRRYLTSKGFMKPLVPKEKQTFKKTEGATRFEYGSSVANAFAGWSTKQRDNGILPLFNTFYEQLSEEHKKDITITNNPDNL